MPPHGIVAVRAHLAKLPPTESVAERRAMYDRAERVFTLPPDTTVEPVTAGGRPAEWIRPAGTPGDNALPLLHRRGYPNRPPPPPPTPRPWPATAWAPPIPAPRSPRPSSRICGGWRRS